MASDLNKIILIGRLVRDPELRYTPNGTSVANFSIANNRNYVTSGEKKESTSFFNCIAWSKLGELIVQFCKKGNRIALEGRLQQRSWEDQDGKKRSTVEIVAENVQFLTPRDGVMDMPEQIPIQTPSPNFPGPTEIDENPFSDDDIPF